MATLFTKIIRGEIPGRFVFRDARAVAFLTIRPIKPGHVLVVPVEEIDHWLDLPPELNAHLFQVAQKVGRALQHAYAPVKVGMLVAGLEVPHVHLHLLPVDEISDLDFAKQHDESPAALDAAAEKIRAALRALGETAA
jgi:histidine triad (HIT) family protein